jgi:hypothetical protein
MSSNLHGFVDNAGAITTVDFPGSTQTAVFAINDAGSRAISLGDLGARRGSQGAMIIRH